MAMYGYAAKAPKTELRARLDAMEPGAVLVLHLADEASARAEAQRAGACMMRAWGLGRGRLKREGCTLTLERFPVAENWNGMPAAETAIRDGLHYIGHSVAHWFAGKKRWKVAGVAGYVTPARMAKLGLEYHGPCPSYRRGLPAAVPAGASA